MSWLTEQALLLVLVLFRASGFLAMAPVIGGRQVPRTVKVALAMALAALWFGEAQSGPGVGQLAAEFHRGELAAPTLALICSREILLGCAVGWTMGLFLIPGRIAGIYLGHEAGLSMASVVDPNSNASGNVVSELLDVLATMLFFALDAHHLLLTGLHRTLQVWPVGQALPSLSPLGAADRVSALHHTGLLAVLPAATLLFVVMCGLLVLMRSAPQFSLFSIGQALRVGVGLVAMLMFLPHTLTVLMRSLGELRAALGSG